MFQYVFPYHLLGDYEIILKNYEKRIISFFVKFLVQVGYLASETDFIF